MAGLLVGCVSSDVGDWPLKSDPSPAAPDERASGTNDAALADEPLMAAGALQFRWQGSWPELPEGFELGNTHGGIDFASDGRAYVSSDVHGILVVTPDGTLESVWGGPLVGGVHGLSVREEAGRSRLWVTHTGRHEVLELDLKDGRVLTTFGCPLEAQTPGGEPIYAEAGGYLPTGVTTSPDGHVWVADGYGASWVHEFGADGDYLRSVGGPGSEAGEFRTCHGILFDVAPLDGAAGLLVADRENGRLQRFDLGGIHVETLAGNLRRPCSVDRFNGAYAVADLAGRVTLLDLDGDLIGHLGENADSTKWANHGVPPEEWEVGSFTSPHFAAWDARGNLYVMDWVAAGRITKLGRVAP